MEEASKKETSKTKTVVHNGKRVKVWKHTAPVSGDTFGLREVGIFTSKKMEEAAGISTEESTQGGVPIFARLYEHREEMYGQFVDDFIVEPTDYKRAEYTEDDLMDIMLAIFNRGVNSIMVQGDKGASAGKSFPEGPGGADAGTDVPPTAKPTK